MSRRPLGQWLVDLADDFLARCGRGGTVTVAASHGSLFVLRNWQGFEFECSNLVFNVLQIYINAKNQIEQVKCPKVAALAFPCFASCGLSQESADSVASRVSLGVRRVQRI